MKLYCIYDKVSKELSAPFLSKNDETAKRMWKNDCQKVSAENLKDYDLVCVGYFDPEYDFEIDGKKSPINTMHDGVVVVLVGSSLVDEDESDLVYCEGLKKEVE